MGSPMSSPVSRRPSAEGSGSGGSGSAQQTSPEKAAMLRRESSSGGNMKGGSSSNMRLSMDSLDNSSSNNNNININNISGINSTNKTSIPSVNKYDTKINSNVTTINNVSTMRTYTGHTYGKSPVRSSYSPTPYSSSSTSKPNAGRYSAENIDIQGTYADILLIYVHSFSIVYFI